LFPRMSLESETPLGIAFSIAGGRPRVGNLWPDRWPDLTPKIHQLNG
jgi:hypothetical protein